MFISLVLFALGENLEETEQMKVTTLATTAALLTAGLVFAGAAQAATGGSLDPSKCDAAWTMASPNGDTLSKDQAVHYVINFTMVDTDADGKISKAEFSKACANGQIKPADQWTSKDMNN
jgi:hypothetical protein